MRHRSKKVLGTSLLVTVIAVLAQIAFAQARPHVTAVDPQAGKVGDNITLTGDTLGKDAVAAVFLSDDTTDHKAVIVEQSADKIVMKVPQLKAANYNVGIQVGEQIFVLPLRFNVQE